MLWFRIPLLLSILVSFVTTISPARADLLMTQTNRSATGDVKIPRGGVGNLVKELNLSRDQIQRIQKLRADAQGKTKERRQALRLARQELNQLLQGNASADLVRQKRQQVQSLQREVADNNFENTLAIREMLTPDQRVKLQQLIQQRRQNQGGAN
jgi:periplasmic protein CpxP/Spy